MKFVENKNAKHAVYLHICNKRTAKTHNAYEQKKTVKHHDICVNIHQAKQSI